MFFACKHFLLADTSLEYCFFLHQTLTKHDNNIQQKSMAYCAKRARIPNIWFLILSRMRTFLMHILSFVDMHNIWSNINPIYIMKTIYCNRIQTIFGFCHVCVPYMSSGRKYPESPNIRFWILSRIRTSLMHILSFVDMHHIWSNMNPVCNMKTKYCIGIRATF